MSLDLDRMRENAAAWIGQSWGDLPAQAQEAIDKIINREQATYEKCVLRSVREFCGFELRRDVLDALYTGPFYEIGDRALPGYFLTVARALERCGFHKEAERFESRARIMASIPPKS